MNEDILDPDSTQTTKVVLGLLKKGNLLGKGHHVYMDNYYSNPDLFFELHNKECFACGPAERTGKICQKL